MFLEIGFKFMVGRLASRLPNDRVRSSFGIWIAGIAAALSPGTGQSLVERERVAVWDTKLQIYAGN